MTEKRFTEPWYTSAKFLSEILVTCPKCGNMAQVTGHSKYHVPFKPTVCKFSCSSCGYTKSQDDNIWNGTVVGYGKRICGTCGNKWLEFEIKHSQAPKKLENYGTVKCLKCNTDNEVEINWHKEIFNGNTKDPYFGFDLFLQKSLSKGIFWCYNLEHAVYLEKYISAKLRERNKYAGKYSLITNLKSWIKDSKNRDLILKTIDEFKKKLKD